MPDLKNNKPGFGMGATPVKAGAGVGAGNMVIEQLTKMQERLSVLEKENKRLSYAADKGLLSTYDNRNKIKRSSEVKLRTYNNRIVLGWGNLTSNICEKDSNGIWHENQKFDLVLEGNDVIKDVNYLLYCQQYRSIPATVKSETVDDMGNTMLEVEIEGGKIFKIDIKFVN